MADETTIEHLYRAEDVVHLNSQHVRLRPSMFFGDTGESGLHCMAQEIVDNALGEVHRGHGSHIVIEILRNGGLRVRDEGRGIPVDPAPVGEKHVLELLCTRIRNLHGLGLVAVTALSRRLVVEVRRDGFRRRQTFSRGEATSPLEMLGRTTKTGTTITLWPDPQIFTCIDFSFIRLRQRIEDFAMVNSRLHVRLVDQRVDPPLVSVVHYPNGLLDGLEQFSRGRHAVHPTVIKGSSQDGETHVSVAFRWQHADTPRIWSLCNGGTNPRFGTHVSGFYHGLTRSLHRAMPDMRRMAEEGRKRRISVGEDLRAGIVAIIAVECPEPQYSNAIKDRVNNEEFDRLTAALTDRLLTAFLVAHPDEARAIAQHLEAPTTIDPKTGR